MDEFTTAMQEPDEAMQEPFETLAEQIHSVIFGFIEANPDIEGWILREEVLKALNAVEFGILHAEDYEEEEDGEDGEEEDDDEV